MKNNTNESLKCKKNCNVENELKKKVRKLNRDTPFDYACMAILIIFGIMAFYPMWYVIIGSFSNGIDYMKGGVYFWPRVFTLANYKMVFKYDQIWNGMLVSILRCLTGPLLQVLFTSTVAYAMSRKNVPLKKVWNTIFLIPMFISGGLIPYYLTVKLYGLLKIGRAHV